MSLFQRHHTVYPGRAMNNPLDHSLSWSMRENSYPRDILTVMLATDLQSPASRQAYSSAAVGLGSSDSNLTVSLRKYSGMVPVGPLRCLDTMISATFSG